MLAMPRDIRVRVVGRPLKLEQPQRQRMAGPSSRSDDQRMLPLPAVDGPVCPAGTNRPHQRRLGRPRYPHRCEGRPQLPVASIAQGGEPRLVSGVIREEDVVLVGYEGGTPGTGSTRSTRHA